MAATALRPYLDRAATPYSPLVLYGPHGVGKSHLAQGLAAWWKQHFPAAKALSLPGSEFAQSYAHALETQSLERWRRQLRDLSLLVIDDLGQLAGKRPAQQELVITLDALADRDAWVVVTSHSLPAHCSSLLAGLRSRLSAGLAVGLSPPAAATRRVLVEQLAAERMLSLSKRAVKRLADSLEATVPGLISALLDLDLQTQTAGESLDDVGVSEFVAARNRAANPSLRDIASATARYFGFKLSELKSASRRQSLVRGRGAAMYLARELTDHSLAQIGAYFGRRDHTTVLHSCQRTEQLVKRDRETRAAVAELKRFLNTT